MEGKNREGLPKETPLPLLQMELLPVSVIRLPSPWPVTLGGGCHKCRVSLWVSWVSGGDCCPPWAPRHLQGC